MAVFTLIMFVLGFALLVMGADWLVKGASALARRFGISELVIGLTVVAFGTSTPELFVNVVASINGNTGIAIGNVLGSNIANILLILGIAAIIHPLSVTRGTVWKEIPFSLLAAVVLALAAGERFFDGSPASGLARADGGILICFFTVFLYYSSGIAKKIEGMPEHVPSASPGAAKSALYIVLGLAGLTLGGKWIVEGALQIAKALELSESLIGLTIVALGTSLPELATSAMAAYRRNVEIAVGNVVGSNIFNIFFVLGVSSVIKPLPFQPGSIVDIAMVVFASVLLFGFMFTGKRKTVDRWEGVVFVCLYLSYVVFLIFSS